MSARLREALDDLVRDVPAHVVTPDLAGRAWVAGARRRWRRRLATTTAVAAGLAALLAITVAPVVGGLASIAPADSDAGVTGYPQRIGHQWWVRDLPDRPGPVAGLMEVEGSRWFAVSERGRLWRLPGYFDGEEYPTLSPDGRIVGYLAGRDGPYVLHDLTSGVHMEFPEIGSGVVASIPGRYGMIARFPSFWSPDGTRVLMEAQRRGPGAGEVNGGLLVLGTDGSLEFLERAQMPWYAVGWADDHTLLVLTWTREQGPDAVNTRIGIEEMSLDGRTGRLTLLRPSSPWRRGFLHQWTAAASPDGSRLAMVEENSEFPRLHMYSLVDGRELGAPVPVMYESGCGVSWAGDSPAVPIHMPAVLLGGMSSYGTTAIVEDGEARPIVAVEPRLKAVCLVWATDALAGEPRGGLIFGTNDLFVTWWGEEAAALLALVAGLVLLLRWRRRRRTERRQAASSTV